METLSFWPSPQTSSKCFTVEISAQILAPTLSGLCRQFRLQISDNRCRLSNRILSTIPPYHCQRFRLHKLSLQLEVAVTDKGFRTCICIYIVENRLVHIKLSNLKGGGFQPRKLPGIFISVNRVVPKLPSQISPPPKPSRIIKYTTNK